MNNSSMRVSKSATNRRKKSRQDTGLLKAVLITGAVAATIVGTRMLSIQDNLDQIAQLPANTITIENTANAPTTINNLAPDRAITLDLQPVPQAFQPNVQTVRRIRPVVRTHSS